MARSNSLELRVAGVEGTSCAASAELALLRFGGVLDVTVDVIGGRVRVGIRKWELRDRLLMTAAAAVLLLIAIALEWVGTSCAVWL